MAKTVLLVDDNPAIRHALCGLFGSQTDFEVCGEAENGQEAIQKAERLRPDLIVMDLSMPVMNGIEFLKRLRATPGGTAPLVVLFSTRVRKKAPVPPLTVPGHLLGGSPRLTTGGASSAWPLITGLDERYGFETDVGHLTVFGRCADCRAGGTK